MSITAEKECEHLSVKRGIEAHEHDLIHELGRRLSCLWGYDRCVANASGQPELQDFWRHIKSQEQRNIDELKKLIKQHVQTAGGDRGVGADRESAPNTAPRD